MTEHRSFETRSPGAHAKSRISSDARTSDTPVAPETRPASGTTLSAEEARARLEQNERTTLVSRKDRATLVASMVGLAVLMGGMLPVLAATIGNPGLERNLRFTGAIMSGGMLLFSIFLLLAGMRRVNAYPRGFARTYLWGVLSSMAIYSVALVAMMTVNNGDVTWGMPVVWGLGVLVALPTLIAAVRLHRGEKK